jgi:segregation and condensation protein B
MNEKQRKEEKLKLKQLRKELEEKIKGIIPESLREEAPSDNQEEERGVVTQEVDEAFGKRIIEALLFVSVKPLTTRELSRILQPLTGAQISKIIKELKNEYNEQERSFRIIEIAGGYELSTLPEYSPWLAKLEKEKKAKQASIAALETLAILAYKQPITRVEIEEIRGVDASGVIATLMDRGFIRLVGRKEIPGRPLMYGTTDLFLEHFGLKSLGELPDLQEIKTLVESTIKKEELLRREQMVSNEVNFEEQQHIDVEKEKEKLELETKYDEISQEIEGVKVMSPKQVANILNPQAPAETEETKDTEKEHVTKADEEKESDTHI